MNRFFTCALAFAWLASACNGGNGEPAKLPPTDERPLIETFASPTFRAPGDDRLLIPRIGVDAPLTAKPVAATGTLPDPDGTDDVVMYDFSTFTRQTGLGGLPGDGGNVVAYGRLDAGSLPCRGGFLLPPCEAVFWNLRRLALGDTITVVWKQQSSVYTVVNQCWIETTTQSFDRLLARGEAEMITLFTHAGQFDQNARGYSHFLYVRAERTPNSISRECPVGSPPPAAGPTPTPAPPADITITSLPTTVAQGGEVNLQASTAPGSRCRLVVISQEGTVVAAGGAFRTNEQGFIEYKWRMPESLPSGNYRIEVSCGAKVASHELSIR